MLTIICGEDIISSREYYLQLKKNYSQKGYEIRDISFGEVTNILKWMAESVSLFSEKKIFFSENFNKNIRKDNKHLIEELKKIHAMKDVEIVDWERVSLRDLKLAKVGATKEFKPNETIFKLLDSVYPSNRKEFIRYLDSLRDLDEQFIFIMLIKYVRNLILIKEGIIPYRMQSWQTYRLKPIAAKWKTENLVGYYESLLRLDTAAKSSGNVYTVREALEILACHFL